MSNITRLLSSIHEYYGMAPTPFSINDEDTEELPLLHLGRLQGSIQTLWELADEKLFLHLLPDFWGCL